MYCEPHMIHHIMMVSGFNCAREQVLKAIRQLFGYVILVAFLCGSAHSLAEAVTTDQAFETIEWTDLIPPEVLEILLNPPQYITEIEDGSVEDQISGQIQNSLAAASDDEYQQALASTEVNAAMDGAMVRIPGFVVPLEFDDQNIVTQFLLVPYFGACLHMPPPPPNQIIMVEAPGGITLDELYTPFWISGRITTTISETGAGTSAYSMKLHDFELYTE